MKAKRSPTGFVLLVAAKFNPEGNRNPPTPSGAQSKRLLDLQAGKSPCRKTVRSSSPISGKCF